MGGGERRWDRWSRFLIGGLLVVTLTGSPATAEMQLLPGAAADLDQATVDHVLATFRQAEQALRAGDVDDGAAALGVAERGRIRLQDHHRGHLYGQFVGPVENRRVTCADRQLV